MKQFAAFVLCCIAVLAARSKGRRLAEDDRALFGLIKEEAECDMTTDQLIQHWGFAVESYNVTTADGYILTIFRIPRPRNATENPPSPRPVVFIQHGLLGSSDMWVDNLPTQDAAFLYADAGLDVWIGNFRGNKYGKAHATLSATTDKYKFWDFSWPEMAYYDLPAMINFVLDKTGAPTLYYIGHSMGTLNAFAAFSTNKDLGKKVKKFYALAPVMQLGHLKGPLHTMASFTSTLNDVLYMSGMEEFFPPSWLTKQFAAIVCGGNQMVGSALCGNTLFLIAGPSSNQLNVSRLPIYMSNTPAGTSRRTFAHFGQLIQTGKMISFDFGATENQRRYGAATPYVYDVSQMDTPVGLYVGTVDWLATPEDVGEMRPKLKNVFSYNLLSDFNHMDFLWGARAAAEVYLPIKDDITQDFASSGGKTK